MVLSALRTATNCPQPLFSPMAWCRLEALDKRKLCANWGLLSEIQHVHCERTKSLMKGEGRKGGGRTGMKFSGARSRLNDHWGPFYPWKKKKAKEKKSKPQRLLCKIAPLVNSIQGRGKKEYNCILLSEATWSNKRIAFAHLRMECEASFRCSDRIWQPPSRLPGWYGKSSLLPAGVNESPFVLALSRCIRLTMARDILYEICPHLWLASTN